MSGNRVLVIEHQGNAGSGLIGDALKSTGLELITVGPDTDRVVPQTLDGYDALVVLGGSMGPTDDDEAPWLPATRELLNQGVEEGVPTLGICLGGQLLATAVGGHVRLMPQGPEVGLRQVTFNEASTADELFAGFDAKSASAVQWHWLEVDQLPEQATVLASSPLCETQAFRVGNRAWGVQFHPEALGDTAVEWVVEDPEGLDVAGLSADQVVADVRAAEPILTETWSALAVRFSEIVQLVSRGQESAA